MLMHQRRCRGISHYFFKLTYYARHAKKKHLPNHHLRCGRSEVATIYPEMTDRIWLWSGQFQEELEFSGGLGHLDNQKTQSINTINIIIYDIYNHILRHISTYVMRSAHVCVALHNTPNMTTPGAVKRTWPKCTCPSQTPCLAGRTTRI